MTCLEDWKALDVNVVEQCIWLSFLYHVFPRESRAFWYRPGLALGHYMLGIWERNDESIQGPCSYTLWLFG